MVTLKAKMALGMATVVVGAMAALGGTLAYFSDAANSNDNTFTNGTVVLRPHEPYIERFAISRFKPGDVLDATSTNQSPAMTLNNQGTLPFDVYLKLDESSQKGTDKDLIVQELKFGGTDLLTTNITAWDTNSDGVVTLNELKAGISSNASLILNGNNLGNVGFKIGVLNQQGSNDSIKSVTYKIKFRDTGVEQNILQGDTTNVSFHFLALQQEGTEYSKTSGNISNHLNGSGGGLWDNN